MIGILQSSSVKIDDLVDYCGQTAQKKIPKTLILIDVEAVARARGKD
jgi:hypothetical protein